MFHATDPAIPGGHRDARLPDSGQEDLRGQKDIKKLALIVGLGLLSWVATYIGMLELIEANMGDLPIVHRVIVGFSVAMLMTMIIWLLDQMFAPIPAFTKLVYAMGYVFLTVVSVGFGFGFYWKVLESRAESSRSAEAAVGQVQSALYGAAARLEQLDGTLVTLAQISTEKAEIERTKGTSCPNSRPGDGPRRKMRDEDAQRFQFASDFVRGRATAVKAELQALDGDLLKITNRDPSTFDASTGTRAEFLKSLSRKLDRTVTGFNAFRTDPQLRQLRQELADRAERSTFGDPKAGGFVCPDAQLQGALRGSVRAIDELPTLEKPTIANVEGAEATVEAFRRLTATLFGLLSLKMPPTADELRALQQRAVQSLEDGGEGRHHLEEPVGLSKRDYIPLAIAVFVDLCLLLVSMGRPVNRLQGLLPKMRAAEASPVSQILSRFNDIHRDAGIRQTFEVFRHVVFDQGGVYYVAVPLDAPYRANPRNPDQLYGYAAADAEALQQEAHLLANLFTSFEKERIFARVYSPLLTTRAIQRKLARQGSKFAGCQAFRVYRFRDGAWPEIILGAVMGAAKRAEAARAGEDARVGGSQSRSGARDELPGQAAAVRTTGEPASRRPTRSGREGFEHHRSSTQATGQHPGGTPHAGRRPRPALDDLEPDLVAKHGPYARFAKADLRQGEDADVSFRSAANSNTAPTEPGAEADTVVPLPVRPRAVRRPGGETATTARQEDAEVLTQAAALNSDEPQVDIVLRRETATYSIPLSRVPVSRASLPVTLFGGDGTATVADDTGPQPRVDGSNRLDEPILQIAAALGEGGAATDKVARSGFDNEIESEREHDDIAVLAGRLRPAAPAE